MKHKYFKRKPDISTGHRIKSV